MECERLRVIIFAAGYGLRARRIDAVQKAQFTVNRRVINIGSGVETSVRSLAQMVLEVMGGGAEWIFKDDQDAGSSRLCADLTLARSKLGYQPRVTLQDGLERMLSRDLRFQRTQPTTA